MLAMMSSLHLSLFAQKYFKGSYKGCDSMYIMHLCTYSSQLFLLQWRI